MTTDSQISKEITIEDEMLTSYMDYAMSVIASRALPDVRDGLKPVHRRILYSMFEDKITSRRPFSKCGKIVGAVLGNFHPHGDQAIYDALVRMAQNFSLRYPLIEGQGNFGSIDGDPPAAYRYTEARMRRIGEMLLEDIDKETVDHVDTYDAKKQEPTVLPTLIPNLLINGVSGIAVGMATNMAPHNLSEVIDGLVLLIDDPDVTIDDLMEVIPGPDFPTGGQILGTEGSRVAYSTGRGGIKLRAKAEIEELSRGKQRITITELPYQANKERLIESIANLVKDKRIEYIQGLKDLSDGEKGIRIVIDVKADISAKTVLNQLYRMTQLETSFNVNNLALINNGRQPRLLNLKEILTHFIKHRFEVIRRRSEFDLKNAKHEALILRGKLKFLSSPDEGIEIIRTSETVEEARTRLMEHFDLVEVQANSILNMRLTQLVKLSKEELEQEFAEKTELIAYLENLLANEQEIYRIMKEEALRIKEEFGDERRTKIIYEETEEFQRWAGRSPEKYIPEEQVVITRTHQNYIKSMSAQLYQTQRRGGKGIFAMDLREEDFVENIVITSNHSRLLFFSNLGKVYGLKAWQIPKSGKRMSRGIALASKISLDPGETVTTMISVEMFELDKFLFTATKKGMIKKTPLSSYVNIRKSGLRALRLREGDELVGVDITSGNSRIILGSKKGKAISFSETDVRPSGRVTYGVRGMRLKGGDEVVSMVRFEEEDLKSQKYSLLTVTEKGFGKRTDFDRYRHQNRGGQGVINIKTALTTDVVSILSVSEDDELMVITSKGKLIRLRADSIRKISRNTKGVVLMKFSLEGDRITAVEKTQVVEEDEEEEEDIDIEEVQEIGGIKVETDDEELDDEELDDEELDDEELDDEELDDEEL
ncbi:MAG: DNA gyrase subunit A, partial [Promethearchaeota archaeon]